MILHESGLPADNSNKISWLIGYFWKSSKIWNCHLLQIIGGPLRVNCLPASVVDCRLLTHVTFANILDPDQAWQNVRHKLDPYCLKLIVFLKYLFKKNIIVAKLANDRKSMLNRGEQSFITIFTIFGQLKKVTMWLPNQLTRCAPCCVWNGHWAKLRSEYS